MEKTIGKNVLFQRYARVTGYLTSTIDRWNDAKRDELSKRVKHGNVNCPCNKK